jgi:hypothetical protein
MFRTTLDPGRAMSGSFGAIFDENGNELTQFNRFEATDTINFQEMNLLGTRRVKHKVTTQSGEGTIAGYKVTSDFLKALVENPTRTFTFVAKIDDPEAYGHERIRYRGVRFSKNNLSKFQAGQVVEEEWPFVFDEDPELLDTVVTAGASGSTVLVSVGE